MTGDLQEKEEIHWRVKGFVPTGFGLICKQVWSFWSILYLKFMCTRPWSCLSEFHMCHLFIPVIDTWSPFFWCFNVSCNCIIECNVMLFMSRLTYRWQASCNCHQVIGLTCEVSPHCCFFFSFFPPHTSKIITLIISVSWLW